jgi:succinyl-CoA synthetase beta subunit
MAKLHEYQAKALIKKFDIDIPRGDVASSPDEARLVAEKLGGEIVVKAQAWITSRGALGLIRFARTPEEVMDRTANILGQQVKNFTIDKVLIEQKLEISREFYAGLIIDDIAQAPRMIFSSSGGSGIEERYKEEQQAVSQQVVDIRKGLMDYEARDLVRRTGIHGRLQMSLAEVLVKLYTVAVTYHARAAEINPLVLTKEGKLVAADCRITIDDNAVYRFPELGIEIAREFDRPPTQLEKIAWEVEKNDYRGTFYFIQMEQNFHQGEGVIGFHGAGGGGSMMSMDALLNQGFKLADFVDTSGNPPASKVYRAARIILSQGEIDGYFASGSGVASQEQFHSARGLVKAFMEQPLKVPAIIRLGGNAEEQAISILKRAQTAIPARIEGYGKDDTPEFCVERLKMLIEQSKTEKEIPSVWEYKPAKKAYEFETVTGGKVILDHDACRRCESKICINTCTPHILSLEDGVPVLNISREDAQKGRCSECLACEIECYFEGNRGGFVYLPIPGLEGIV